MADKEISIEQRNPKSEEDKIIKGMMSKEILKRINDKIISKDAAFIKTLKFFIQQDEDK